MEIAAPSKHVLLTAQGAYLKLEGGDIELGAPGTVEFKASKRELTTPVSAEGQALDLAGGDLDACEFKEEGAAQSGQAVI